MEVGESRSTQEGIRFGIIDFAATTGIRQVLVTITVDHLAKRLQTVFATEA